MLPHLKSIVLKTVLLFQRYETAISNHSHHSHAHKCVFSTTTVILLILVKPRWASGTWIYTWLLLWKMRCILFGTNMSQRRTTLGRVEYSPSIRIRFISSTPTRIAANNVTNAITWPLFTPSSIVNNVKRIINSSYLYCYNIRNNHMIDGSSEYW